jgi:hypothetical protein
VNSNFEFPAVVGEKSYTKSRAAAKKGEKKTIKKERNKKLRMKK